VLQLAKAFRKSERGLKTGRSGRGEKGRTHVVERLIEQPLRPNRRRGAGLENAILGAAMAFHADTGFGPDDAVSDIGACIGGGGIQPKGLVHQDAEAAIAAHQNGEFLRSGRIRGGRDIQNPAGVIEKTLHSKRLIGKGEAG
jgi:hypothetical protein